MTKFDRSATAGLADASEVASESRAGMQLISRAAAVLRALEGQPSGVSLGQIAAATGLPRPTVQRIVDALCVEGLTMIDPMQGGIRLGALVGRLANSVRIDLVALARPHLDHLARITQETVAMTVLQDGRVVVLAIATPPMQAIRLTASVGSIWPLHSSADGMALLSGLPEATIRALLPEPLEARTPNTVTAVSVLLREIDAIADSGIAVDEERTAIGISAIAARLVDAAGTRHTISLLVPATRFPERALFLREELTRCRAAILAATGSTS